MTGWGWLGMVLAGLALGAVALRAIGHGRWAQLMDRQASQLEESGVEGLGWPRSCLCFSARDLVGLPAPVQRYFHGVLTEGQPIIAAATLEMRGTINLSTDAQRWKPFTSQQRVVTRRPGFLWDARVALFPGVPVHVEDSYIAGRGRLVAKVLGLFTVAHMQGEGEIARGEFMRYFAESPWYPTALLPSQGVQWQAVDDASARATLVDGPNSLTLLFRFDELGLITSVHAASRGVGLGQDGGMVMRPWDCTLSDYQLQQGMLIPMAGEAAWVQAEGRKVYFVGRVKTLRYRFLP